jgi:hypothetical protein
MIHNKKARLLASFTTLGAISVSAAFAATSPYDLIRPTWPLSWDEKVFEKFDTTITKKTGMLPKATTPESFKAGELIPDTLDQAYLDAINTKISPIRVNQAGYLESDKERQFYFVGSSAEEFEVVDAYGKSLSKKVTGTFTKSEAETESNWTIVAGTSATTPDQQRYKVELTGPSGKVFIGKIPQTVPTNKRLRIKVGNEISSTFIVSDNVYSMAKDASLKFFGIQRSGNSESWFHGPSHMKDGGGAIVTNADEAGGTFDESRAGSLAGGWYDCGDYLKESQTQAFAFMALAVMSATNPSKDVDHYAYNQADFVNTDKVPDVLREAKHGADFFLKAYNFAKGVIDDMPVSVGNFGSDHALWTRPEAQDYLPTDNSSIATDRGGPASRTVRLGELGSNIAGEIAAGLAILSKDYAKYDKKFADSCLTVAEKMYDFAKALAQGKSSYDGDKKFKNNKKATDWGSLAYIGNNEFYDDMALASVALLYATGKKQYADDMFRTKSLVPGQQYGNGAGFFEGGWFVTDNKAFLKNTKNTSWANSYTYALYALYKLILADKTKATTEYGLTEDERLAAIEDCLANMIANLGDIGNNNGGSVTLPAGDISFKQNKVSYDPIWYNMMTDQLWNFNRYQMGNVFEVLAYSDVAADIEKQGITFPKMAQTDLKANEMKQLGINQLNYMLGMNPWDISFVYGIGDKNDAHPHHRASNPEGRNTPGISYKYNCPVGALFGGPTPTEKNTWEPNGMSWEYYFFSETCLDASTVLLSALTILSNGGDDYYEKKCDNCKTEATPALEGAYATAYHYTWKEADNFSIRIVNESLEKLDSITAYIYFDATEDDIESCGLMFDVDICTLYDIAGFSQICATKSSEFRNYFKENGPQKVEGTENKDKKTYTWAQAIPVGSINIGNKIRLDVTTSSGMKSGGKCETLAQPAKTKITDGWSFASHAETKDTPAYDGAPDWEKDYGDIQDAPKDPYIVIRDKGKLLWGYGPGKTTSDRVGFVNVAKVSKARMLLSDNRLFVLATAQGTKTLKIFDMLGNQLLEKSFDGTRAEVNLANIPHRGTLVARVMQNNKALSTKAFKVR